MIAVLLDDGTLHTVAPLVIAVLMVWALAALTAAVRRTSTHRHARWWSPPRPHRLLTTGKHAARRGYQGRHTPATHLTTRPDITHARTAS